MQLEKLPSNTITLVGTVYKSHFFFVCASLSLVGDAWVGLDCTVPVALRIFQFVLGLVWGVLVISRVANLRSRAVELWRCDGRGTTQKMWTEGRNRSSRGAVGVRRRSIEGNFFF